MSRVLIGVPVFNGLLTLPETLRCIQQQDFSDFEVIVSLDGGDEKSEEAIRPFLRDPRFRQIHQTERLGWAGNLEWVINQCQSDYFCYWQQDDLASHNYISDLISLHEKNPGASVTYTDVQWFGDMFSREVLHSLNGQTPRDRVLQYIDTQHWIPLRGLIRAELLLNIPDCARLCSSSPWENGFLGFLAGSGPLLRSEGSLYFKRSHRQQWGSSFERRPPDQRRVDWITRARSLLKVLDTFCSNELTGESLTLILNRFLNSPKDRFVDYRYTEPPAIGRFLRDWISIYPNDLSDRLAICPKDGNAEILAEAHADSVRRQVVETSVRLSFAGMNGSSGESYLGFGWSHREFWGVWSEVVSPNLLLPKIASEALLILHGRHYGLPGRRASITWSIDERVSGTTVVTCMDSLTLELPLRPGDRILTLQLPDALIPAKVGGSLDTRRLGFGIVEMEICLDS